MTKVSEDSWHYKMYRAYRVLSSESSRNSYFRRRNSGVENSFEKTFEDYHYMPHNFCVYWRGVLLWPVLNFVLTSVVFLWLLALIPSLLFLLGVELSIGAGVFVAVALALAATGFALARAKENVEEFIEEKFKDEESLIRNIYFTYKEKICPMIEYKKKGE